MVVEGQVYSRSKRFSSLTAEIGVPLPPGSERGPDGGDSPLPTSVKYRFVLLGPDRTEALHPAHIVDAVHGFAPSLDCRVTLATPIIESRVTSAGRASSPHPSAPAGRSCKKK